MTPPSRHTRIGRPPASPYRRKNSSGNGKSDAAYTTEMIKLAGEAIRLRVDLQHRNTQIALVLTTGVMTALLAFWSDKGLDQLVASPLLLLVPGIVVIQTAFMLRFLNHEDNMVDYWLYLDEVIRPRVTAETGRDLVDLRSYLAAKRYRFRGVLSLTTLFGNDGFILLFTSLPFLAAGWAARLLATERAGIAWLFDFLLYTATVLVAMHFVLGLLIASRYPPRRGSTTSSRDPNPPPRFSGGQGFDSDRAGTRDACNRSEL